MTLVETATEIGSSGFTIAWTFDDDPRGEGIFFVNFKAYEVAYSESRIGDGPVDTRPHYDRAGSTDNSIDNMTPDLAEAEVYASGYMKWDGCCTVSLGDGVHMCGQESWQAHVDLMAYLWRRAGELMGDRVLDGEFLPLTLKEAR